MSGLLEYLKPLQQFVQANPIVFWSTMGLAAVVILLFVVLPAERSEDPAPARKTAAELRGSGSRAESARPSDTNARFADADADRRVDVPESTRPAKAAGGPPSVQDASVRGVPATDAGRESGRFTVQVGSFASEESAQRLAKKLGASGYPVFVKAARVTGSGVTYRVRVGAFATREEAQRFGDKLVADEASVKSVFATIND